MATLAQSRTQSSILDRIGHIFEGLRARYAQYRVYSTTLDELQRLSPRELEDLGLNPSMLKQVAHDAAYCK